MNAPVSKLPRRWESLLTDCAEALRGVAEYRLPAAVDRRLTHLAENKEALTPEERSELLALVELAEGRTLDKVKATAALKRLTSEFPNLAAAQP